MHEHLCIVACAFELRNIGISAVQSKDFKILQLPPFRRAFFQECYSERAGSASVPVPQRVKASSIKYIEAK